MKDLSVMALAVPSAMKFGVQFIRFSLSILVTMAAVKGHGAGTSSDPDANKPNVAVLQLAPTDQGPAPTEGDLEFRYNAAEHDPREAGLGAKVDAGFLRAEAAKMAAPEYANELKAGVVVPVAIADAELLQNALVLSPRELEIFLKKKTVFLRKTGNVFRAIKFPVGTVNKILQLMNKAFFKNAAVVSEANTKVLSLQLGAAIGAGLPDWLMKAFRRSPILADIPERAGFYIMLSAGFSIVTKTKNGRLKIGIEPVIDFRRATRIFSPFVFGAAGFTGSFTMENREREKSAIQKIGFYRISSLNVFSSANHFGFSGSVAAAFPPGGGAAAGMEGEVYRFRVTPSNFKQLGAEFISTLRRLVYKCESLF
ncbi:MAG: hypothetical protein AAB250_06595 [Bdellovibrionota bacterium]